MPRPACRNQNRRSHAHLPILIPALWLPSQSGATRSEDLERYYPVFIYLSRICTIGICIRCSALLSIILSLPRRSSCDEVLNDGLINRNVGTSEVLVIPRSRGYISRAHGKRFRIDGFSPKLLFHSKQVALLENRSECDLTRSPLNNGGRQNHTYKKSERDRGMRTSACWTHKMVTTVWPSCHPICFTNLTHATKLHALLDPRNKPSCWTR